MVGQTTGPDSSAPRKRGLVDRLVDKVCGPERNAWKPSKERSGFGEIADALSIAVLAALLMKYFAAEVYQIPTSSMQPTLMGSSEAGVFDRVLVDKTAYLFQGPNRWDVAVFRYPLQKNQPYVKRAVGIPGDRLRLRSGNVLTVDDNGQATGMLVKPDRIQEGLWREIYPRRREIRQGMGTSAGKDPLDGWWKGRGGDWQAQGDDLKVELRSRGNLTFEGMDRGLVNHVWDGYPVDTAIALKRATQGRELESVTDVRLAATVVAPADAKGVHLELLARRPDNTTRSYRAECEGGIVKLTAKDSAGEWTSATVPCELPPGKPVRLRFAMQDGMLRFWRDGSLIAENNLFITTADARFVLLDDEPVGDQDRAAMTARIQLLGKGSWGILQPTVERDLHYTWRGSNHSENTVVEVPEGHYWMLGDNTLQSVDSRGWTGITVAVDEAGHALDPKLHPNLPVLVGNRRPMPINSPIDPDETPIALVDRDRMVMIDEWGERHSLKTRFDQDYGLLEVNELRYRLKPLVAATGDPELWEPEEAPARFVPREHFQGRAMLYAYPIEIRPWKWGRYADLRLGLVR